MERISEQKTVTARKQHSCDYCGIAIEKGVKYQSAFYKHDGIAYGWKNHTHCQAIADKLKMFDGDRDEGLTGESFKDYITERYFDLNPESVERVRFNEMLAWVLRYYNVA